MASAHRGVELSVGTPALRIFLMLLSACGGQPSDEASELGKPDALHAVPNEVGGKDDGDAGLHASFIGCRGPLDPGCQQCKSDGPYAYRKGSEGVDWYNEQSAEGACEPNCPACASCTYRDEAESLEALGRVAECEPCPDDVGVDPCFGVSSCECWCSRTAGLREACPTLWE